MNQGTASNALPSAGATLKRQSENDEEEPPKRHHLPGNVAESLTDERGRAALHLAAEDGDAERIRVLLERGFDTRARDRRDRTPLLAAMWCGQEAAAEVLTNADSQTDIRDEDGFTPLHIAAWRGYIGVMGKLLAARADTRSRDEFGRTPIHLAIMGFQEAAAELLASADGQNDIPDKNGRTPLYHAAGKGYVQVVKTLLSGGVHPHTEYNHTWHPLREALRFGHYDVARLILASCALRDVPIDWTAMSLPPNKMKWAIRVVSEHEDEIGRMKETRIPESRVTFYAVARRHPCRVAPYLRVESIRHVEEGNGDGLLSEFPNYGELIASKLSQVRERRDLAERCFECFRMLPPLPPSCIEVVLLCLSEGDLRNFLLAMEPRTRS